MIYYTFECGAIAQLVERMNGIHEVTGSTPVSSTILCQGILSEWWVAGPVFLAEKKRIISDSF